MLDKVGNHVNVGDYVAIAVRVGKTADLNIGRVVEEAFKPQMAGGASINMVKVEWSNIHYWWTPASKVIKLDIDKFPENRRERLNNVPEGVQVS